MTQPDKNNSDRRVALVKFVFEWYSQEIEPTEEWDDNAPVIRRLADSDQVAGLDALVAQWSFRVDESLHRAKAAIAAQRQ